MYHLSAPKRFLELGRLRCLPDIQQANMPFTVDLLYLIGLAFGSDEMPGTLHLAFALALAIAIYSFGRELIDERDRAFGAVIFLSGTVVSVFARWPMSILVSRCLTSWPSRRSCGGSDRGGAAIWWSVARYLGWH